MLWLITAGLFGWLVVRELTRPFVVRSGFAHPDRTPIDWAYVAVMGGLAALFLWQPVKYWSLERTLTKHARILAENSRAKVKCNSVFESWFDQNVFAAGHANPETGQIVLQYPWCGHLRDQMGSAKLTREGVLAVHILAHEAMHIRGEMNEAKAECQAIQRHYRAAKMLGMPDRVAVASGLRYYQILYPMREQIGGLAGSYHSPLCAPGREWDEKLTDSTWSAGG